MPIDYDKSNCNPNNQKCIDDLAATLPFENRWISQALQTLIFYNPSYSPLPKMFELASAELRQDNVGVVCTMPALTGQQMRDSMNSILVEIAVSKEQLLPFSYKGAGFDVSDNPVHPKWDLLKAAAKRPRNNQNLFGYLELDKALNGRHKEIQVVANKRLIEVVTLADLEQTFNEVEIKLYELSRRIDWYDQELAKADKNYAINTAGRKEPLVRTARSLRSMELNQCGRIQFEFGGGICKVGPQPDDCYSPHQVAGMLTDRIFLDRKQGKHTESCHILGFQKYLNKLIVRYNTQKCIQSNCKRR
ncbi:MAG: hypothetical protein ABIF10_03360 [Candidatus Woesearchaeota archaeon]